MQQVKTQIAAGLSLLMSLWASSGLAATKEEVVKTALALREGQPPLLSIASARGRTLIPPPSPDKWERATGAMLEVVAMKLAVNENAFADVPAAQVRTFLLHITKCRLIDQDRRAPWAETSLMDVSPWLEDRRQLSPERLAEAREEMAFIVEEAGDLTAVEATLAAVRRDDRD
jgi:hypothetical protein